MYPIALPVSPHALVSSVSMCITSAKSSLTLTTVSLNTKDLTSDSLTTFTTSPLVTLCIVASAGVKWIWLLATTTPFSSAILPLGPTSVESIED